MRRLSVLLCAFLLVLLPLPVHASGGGSTDVAPTAKAGCILSTCTIEVKEFDVNNRGHVFVKSYTTATGTWTTSTETVSFTLGANISPASGFEMAVDNAGHQRCKSSTGWVQDAGTGWDTDAKRGTPGEDGSNFGVVNLAGGVNPDAVYSASWSGDCSSLATSNLSGQTNWSPAAATMGNGAHYVVTGTDSAAYQYIPATGWQSLGGTSVGTPGAVSWDHNNRLDVFVRGSDNAMYHKWWDGTSWSVWESLGGTLTSGPGCTSWGTGRIDCFVIGQGGSDVYHKFYSSGWSAWENLT